MGANFSVTQFKEAVAQSGGFARPIFFQCDIVCPWLSTVAKFDLKQSDVILCKATNIPEEVIDTIDIKYFTHPVSIPGARQYQPLTLTFYNTTKYILRNYFEAWLNLFNQRAGVPVVRGNARQPNPLLETTGTITLTHWNNDGKFKLSLQTAKQLLVAAVSSTTNSLISTVGNAIGTARGHGGPIESNNPQIQYFKFINAFPISIGQLAFSQEDDTTVQTFDVTFKYFYMKSGLKENIDPPTANPDKEPTGPPE